MLQRTIPSVMVLSGTNITSSYTASNPLNLSRGMWVRFWLKTVASAGSGLTTVTVKLQQRYNDGTTTTAYLDLPSNLDDVQGASQPKGPTFEIEHAFTLGAAPSTTSNSFTFKESLALLDLTVNVKANTTGQAGDSITVLAQVVS